MENRIFRSRLVTIALLLTLGASFQQALATESAWKAELTEGENRLKIKELVPAEICFRQAVRDVRRDKSNSPDDVVICLESLAAVLQIEDKTEEAIPLYKKALDIFQKAHGKDSEETVPVTISLGDIFRTEGQYRVASKYYRQALSTVEKNCGYSNLTFADLKHRLGLTIFKAGYPALAEKMYSSSLSVIMQQSRLPQTDLLADVLSDYIDLLTKTFNEGRVLPSDFQAELLKDRVGTLARTQNVGESLWNKTVSVRLFTESKNDEKNLERIQPSGSSPSMVLDKQPSDFVSLAQISKQRLDFYERMIAIDEKTLGPKHPSVARDLTGLAYVYLSQNNYDDAKIILNRALEIYKSAYGSDPLLTRRTELLLNLIDQKQHSDLGDTASIKDYVAALPHIPIEAQKLEIALQLNYLGLLCYSEGKIEDAQKIYAWALPATALASGEQSTLSASCLIDYARILRRAGQQSEAELLERTAHNIMSNALVKQTALLLP